jgi:uncharacterized protein
VRPLILYLHGLASSPESHKGRAFAAYFGEYGYAVDRLDLRLPDRDGLRVSAMIEHAVRRARRHERVVLVGSSLGALVAAHACASLEHTRGVVLMAPAFDFVNRWDIALGPERMAAWRGGEPLRLEDHAGGPPLLVDYGFYEDAVALGPAPAVSAPLLSFHGRRDEVVDIAASRAFIDRTGHGRLVELDDDHGLIESLPVILGESLSFVDRLWRTEP